MNQNVRNSELPYDKFEQFGPQNLTDAELIAIILRTGTKEMDALTLAKNLLNSLPNGILQIPELAIEDLTKQKGIGKVKAIKIKCIGEISKRLSMYQRQSTLRFDMPDTVAHYYMESMRHLCTETVHLILTDNKNQLIKDVELSKGTVNMSILSPREVFLEALRFGAVHMILIHNHPSGDPTPSDMDIHITDTIYKASKIMNIPLIDHIIIGDNKYVSLKNLGYIQ